MKKTYIMTVAFALWASVPARPIAAQAPETKSGQAESKPAAQAPPPKEESSVTEHSIQIAGRTISYKATAGTLLLKNDKGEPTASIFSISYTMNDVKDPAQRPIAFLYNGGPGSSSVWLHMGAFGPKRVEVADAEATPPAPYRLTDNENCLLDAADLVFVDPVGTGFSRAEGKSGDMDFWGVDEDIHSLAQFIASYVSRCNRWNSPKYLIGESYGTFRSAALAAYLQSHDSMDLNGIVMISTVLDLATLSFNPGDDMPYIFYLPSYAATAWYHKVLKERPADLSAFLADARRFAATEYASALMKGSRMSQAEKTAVAQKVSRYTGLSEDYVLKADLRVKLPQFMEELQRSRGLTTGRLDARFSGPTYDLLGEYADYDPQSTSISGAFTAAFNAYVREDLKFGQDKTYKIESMDAAREWNWKRKGERGFGFPGSPNVMMDLVEAMISNAYLRIQVENGLYDLATPFFATEHTMEHLGLPEKLQARIRMNYYDAGHMMYLRKADLAKLKNNVSVFVRGELTN